MMTQIIVSVVVSTISLIGVENYFRRADPVSLFRPSVMLDFLAEKCSELFTLLGYQLARITDLYYLIKEYLLEDFKNILCALWKLIASPLETFRGYYDYYANNMTPLTYGLLSTLVILSVILSFYMYWFNISINQLIVESATK